MAEEKKPPQSETKAQDVRKAHARDDQSKSKPAKEKTRITFTDFASI